MTDVHIVGIDMTRFGRYPDRTVVQLAADAALLALDDCGLSIHDVQALYSGNIGETKDGNAEPDLRQIRVTIGPGLQADLHKSDYRDQHAQVPEPADRQIGPLLAKANRHRGN